MIKVDLITGFLGAGKTTFILKYAKYLMGKGLKIGILEYDYGAMNVDMLLLGKLRGPKCELEMIDASCGPDCTARRLKTKLIAMAMSGYDRVLVEPSGVFDMDVFYDMLRDEPLEKWYEIGSVLAVCDGKLRKNMSPEEDFILATQVAGAGCVVFSKRQLCAENDIKETQEHFEYLMRNIHCTKFHAKYVAKDWDELEEEDYQVIMNSGFGTTDYIKLFPDDKLSFSSVSFMNLPDDINIIKEKIVKLFAEDIYGKIIRVKGFVASADGSMEINATPGDINVRPIAIGRGDIIIIGKDLDRDKIKELMEQEL